MIVLSLWFRKVSDNATPKYATASPMVCRSVREPRRHPHHHCVQPASTQRHHHINVVGRHLDANLDTARANGVYAPGSEAIGVLGQALILLVGGHMVLRGQLSVGELAAFFLYLTAFFAPIQQLVQLYNTYQQGNAAVINCASCS